MHLMRFFSVLLILFLLTACASPSKRSQPTQGQPSYEPVTVSQQDRKTLDAALRYLKQGDSLKAEALFRDVAKSDERLVAPLLNLALLYLREERLLEAESVLKQAIKRKDSVAEVYNLLGVVLRKQGRFQEAKVAYENAIYLRNDYANAHMNIAILYDIYMQDYENAKRHYRRYASLQPDQEKQVNAWMMDLQQRAQVSN